LLTRKLLPIDRLRLRKNGGQHWQNLDRPSVDRGVIDDRWLRIQDFSNDRSPLTRRVNRLVADTS
jgi:hypothetical protein